MVHTRSLIGTLILGLSLSACSYNPFSTGSNELTGSPTVAAAGGAAGAVTAAALGASKSVIVLAGLGGASIGYYVTTLRFASAGIIQNGGQVYTLGDYTTIEIPSDRLFEVNSADFSTEAAPILESALHVLNRSPDYNVMVSGNTSGFGSAAFERKLSEDRARQVSAFLWAHGINQFQGNSIEQRKLFYVGYGNYFPIANDIHANSIRSNSRIQITVYPSRDQLLLSKKASVFNNIGGLE